MPKCQTLTDIQRWKRRTLRSRVSESRAKATPGRDGSSGDGNVHSASGNTGKGVWPEGQRARKGCPEGLRWGSGSSSGTQGEAGLWAVNARHGGASGSSEKVCVQEGGEREPGTGPRRGAVSGAPLLPVGGGDHAHQPHCSPYSVRA